MGRISNEEYAKRKAEADAKAAEENGSAGTEPDLTNPRESLDQAREGAERLQPRENPGLWIVVKKLPQSLMRDEKI